MSQHPNSKKAWAHNALYGQAQMIVSITNGVLMSATATNEAKELAARIQIDARMLVAALKQRN